MAVAGLAADFFLKTKVLSLSYRARSDAEWRLLAAYNHSAIGLEHAGKGVSSAWEEHRALQE